MILLIFISVCATVILSASIILIISKRNKSILQQSKEVRKEIIQPIATVQYFETIDDEFDQQNQKYNANINQRNQKFNDNFDQYNPLSQSKQSPVKVNKLSFGMDKPKDSSIQPLSVIHFHEEAQSINTVGRGNRNRNRRRRQWEYNGFLPTIGEDTYFTTQRNNHKQIRASYHARQRLRERYNENDWEDDFYAVRDYGRQYFDRRNGTRVFSNYGRRYVTSAGGTTLVTVLGPGMHKNRWERTN